MIVTYHGIQDVLLRNGFVFFDEGDYNLNLIGIRNLDDPHANTFNDRFLIAFRVMGRAGVIEFPCTTDPGRYYRKNPLDTKGTAILQEGQHRGLWKIGQHRGQYEALVQRSPVAVIRDNDRDAELDFSGVKYNGQFGINCHRASPVAVSEDVDKWSAGCQVIPDPRDFAILMALANKARTLWGNAFTYTLLNSSQL